MTRNLIWLGYMAFWVGAVVLVNKTAMWRPRTFQSGDVTFVADQRPLGCMMILFFFMGAMVGGVMPQVIHEWVSLTEPAYLRTDHIDALGRLAMVVGGICGAYVGIRAVRLWVLLFLFWVAIYALSGVSGWVLREY